MTYPERSKLPAKHKPLWALLTILDLDGEQHCDSTPTDPSVSARTDLALALLYRHALSGDPI